MDVAVVGAGVVGLAIAAEVAGNASPGPRVVVLERHPRVGQEISSRNSEVVHAGLYYAPGTLKARLCVAGRRALYAFADRHHVAYRKVGKLIVATDTDQVASLEALAALGEANGVDGLALLDGTEVRAREPGVRALAALSSPETGIVDSHGLVSALLGLARARGADVALPVSVTGVDRHGDHWRLAYADPMGASSLTARAVVNAAGLGAQDVMRAAGMSPETCGLSLHLCKGEYFDLAPRHRGRVRGLVYPAPVVDAAGLGIHTVVDLAGGLRLGPSAFYVGAIDYGVDRAHASVFADAVRSFLPFVVAEDLSPAMAGIRPKLAGPGRPARDFYIAHEAPRGMPGLFNLAGIESPGLTAALAIGTEVAAMVRTYLAEG